MKQLTQRDLRIFKRKALSLRQKEYIMNTKYADIDSFEQLIDNGYNPSTNMDIDKINNEYLHVLLNELRPVCKEIIIMLYGLDGNTQKSFREVGIELGVTRERIRQIHNSCIRQLIEMMEKKNIVKSDYL